jgi:hypothetical protein
VVGFYNPTFKFHPLIYGITKYAKLFLVPSFDPNESARKIASTVG